LVLKSMTGYARASASNEAYEVTAEIRTVNHRYLEMRLRAQGRASLAYEKRVRDRVAEALGRGKVDVTLHVSALSESNQEIQLDRPLMKEFVRLAWSIGDELGVESKLSVADLVGFTPAFSVREREPSEDSGVEEAIDRAMALAIGSLEKMRESEGAAMAADLESRMVSLSRTLDEIEKSSLEAREMKRTELEAKVQELLLSAVEPTAIASEVARLVERADVAEEVTRFRSHITLWKSAVAAAEPCGKKLDFIVQEMNREVNTIGSKCQDSAISERVIGMKAELERVREQVQNIE
jgi:uncharacterized protein (TIGR00255 family)